MPIRKCPNRGENTKILKKGKAKYAGLSHTAFCALATSNMVTNS